MRRLQRQQQMAALKKIPVKVMIPEEIFPSVSWLPV